MQALRVAPPTYSEPAPRAFMREPLTAALLSDRPARLVQALGARNIGSVDALTGDLSLLLCDTPDMLIIDLDPETMPARRVAVVVAQLRWLRRDMVIVVARRTAPHLKNPRIDVIFDSEADDEALHHRIAEASRLLAHSRLRPVEVATPAPAAMFRRQAPRRVALFA